MDVTKIDHAEAINLLEQAVAERGADFTYQLQGVGPDASCLYWHEGSNEPGCIVGLALSIAGVPDATLRNLDGAAGGEGGTGISALNHRGVLEKNGIDLSEKALEVFSITQSAQDSGCPWGQALGYGKKEGRP